MTTPEELRELDRKVAELKGITWQGMDMNEFMVGKEWSTNISDAWELFEEMVEKDEYRQIILKGWKGIADFPDMKFKVIDSRLDNHARSYELGNGKTAPEAITRAYIKWKEGK